jgi:hypothetical protein
VEVRRGRFPSMVNDGPAPGALYRSAYP